MGKFCKWLLVLISVTAYGASAEDAQRLLKGEVRYDGNFYFYPSTPNTLYLIGDIGDFDTFEQYSRASVEFRRAIRNHSVKKLVLASGGGAVDIGLNYAAIINDKEFSVYVPESVGCFSACSFMFFGGGEKVAVGPVGVHQFYSSGDRMEQKQKAQQSTQYGVADIIAILNSFQVPPRIYEHMFSRVGNDFYNLTELDLEELGASQAEEWHKDADGVVDALMAVNAELQSLVAFVKGEETPKEVAQQVPSAAPTTQPQQPSRDEIVRLAFIEVQKLLNVHNCGAGTPDGIVGPRTEAAFQRFIDATGARIDFDADDAFEQLINTLSQTKRPACNIVSSKGGFSGAWAIHESCHNVSKTTELVKGVIQLKRSSTNPAKEIFKSRLTVGPSEELAITVTDGKSWVSLEIIHNCANGVDRCAKRLTTDYSGRTGDTFTFTSADYLTGEPEYPAVGCKINLYRVKPML
ncbi:hypothetical protein [Marinobacterium sp. xm-m-312]|uniref:hypothetical protein n=1 Tax=Marinobacterium sp. xm-m-312 TaxID=2497741 RepID=UPI00156A1C2B|nr:hypothetical protein [Marinobacterium sp. xm-m-312]NRQ22733.1 hypothetical protein [Marinobacterium sp. xm-m-312]